LCSDSEEELLISDDRRDEGLPQDGPNNSPALIEVDVHNCKFFMTTCILIYDI